MSPAPLGQATSLCYSLPFPETNPKTPSLHTPHLSSAGLGHVQTDGEPASGAVRRDADVRGGGPRPREPVAGRLNPWVDGVLASPGALGTRVRGGLQPGRPVSPVVFCGYHW